MSKPAMRTSAPPKTTCITDIQKLRRIVFSQAGSRLAQNPLDETLTTERDSLMKEAAEASNNEAGQFGTSVTLIRLNRVDLPESSKESTYARMNANLNKIRSELLSSGDALAATKIAEANRTATETVSGAYLKAQQLKAEGITEAGKIRKEAYSKDPAFYLWYRSWLTKQRIWDRSKPETIFQTGAEEYNKFGGTEK
jgi:membrane protease subunit HflC